MKMLVIIDMINGFVKEGALADPAIQRISAENVRLCELFLKNGHEVVAFRDCHTADAAEFNDFPPHCIAGTPESELIDELQGYTDRIRIFKKNSISSFFAPGFMDYFEQKNISEIVITGCCTDICILNLAIPLKCYFNETNRKIDVIVPENAVDTFEIPGVHSREEWNEMAFRFMKQAGVKVVPAYIA